MWEHAGAELIVLCTNTMHRVADEIIAAVDVPFLHIADATAAVRLEDPEAVVRLAAPVLAHPLLAPLLAG